MPASSGRRPGSHQHDQAHQDHRAQEHLGSTIARGEDLGAVRLDHDRLDLDDAEPDWGDRLHGAGLRNTLQRRLVLSSMHRLGHATPEQLATSVKNERPELNASTVYRTLDVLAHAGLVSHTHLHHGAITYHRVDDDPHIHLVCTRCDRVIQEPLQLVADMAENIVQAAGFRVDLTHLALHGLCADCSGTESGESALEQT